ncbi:hypothetical protein [Rhizobium leguminosarum]|uniref:hypothetical protein n=1 Tax=Rhizobium leguminosarum TaxID=384 RepID=UPI001C93D399|nr:hypothetical protein [Rhizobium leguminosarum]MBY5666638.1 hypothetical protein [Rhizobium leguminosarum]MBY5680089.1 hypothetical protein [Rhizobium leguminosarum]
MKDLRSHFDIEDVGGDNMDEELSVAISALAQECRSGAGIIPTPVGVFADRNYAQAHFDHVNEICDRLQVLANQALERRVTQAEFIVEQARLEAINAFSGGQSYASVQSAFARQGPPWV